MDSTPTKQPADSPLPPWITRHRFDVASYHRMGEAGILRREQHVEQIEGELIKKAAIGGRHVNAVIELTRLLILAAEGRARVSVQNSVRLDDLSEPEPDLALLRPLADAARRTDVPVAADVLLLIEIADTSLR